MLFIGGVVALHRGGGLSLFSIELTFFVPLILYFLLSYVMYVSCLPSDWVVFVNMWQKEGEIDEILEKVFNYFYLGGDEICTFLDP